MTQQQPSTKPHRAVGVFAEQSNAAAAQEQLQTAGFASGQISTDTQTLDPNPPLRKTEAGRSAMGLALIGVVVGGFIGFFIAWFSPAASELKLTFGSSMTAVLFAMGIGATVGAVAGSAFGAFVGVNIPKRETQADRAHLTYRYLVQVEGTDEELDRAIQIMNRQGAEVQR